MSTPLPSNFPWDEFTRDVDKAKQMLLEEPMTRVKFIHREQVVQVITGNDRKGEVTVITRDKDVPAHEVEKTVRKLANTRTD